MFDDIIGEKEKSKMLIVETDDIINYIHYTFGNDLEVDINWATLEVEITGNKIREDFCFKTLKDIHEVLKDKSPFEKVEPDDAHLKSGWVYL